MITTSNTPTFNYVFSCIIIFETSKQPKLCSCLLKIMRLSISVIYQNPQINIQIFKQKKMCAYRNTDVKTVILSNCDMGIEQTLKQLIMDERAV